MWGRLSYFILYKQQGCVQRISMIYPRDPGQYLVEPELAPKAWVLVHLYSCGEKAPQEPCAPTVIKMPCGLNNVLTLSVYWFR